MGNLFGVRRKAPVVTSQDRAILQMKQQRDKIKIYQKKIETELETNKELAFRLFKNNMKERALVVLRRRKAMQEIVNRTDKQLETLEQLVSDIEFTQAEVSVVQGLKVGTEALKQLTSLMNIDDIQQMMDDNQEAAEKQKEISDILQQSAERIDEEELLKELDMLAQSEAITEQASKPQVIENTLPEPVEDSIETKIDELPEAPKDIKEGLPVSPTKEQPIRVEDEEKSDSVKEAELVLA